MFYVYVIRIVIKYIFHFKVPNYLKKDELIYDEIFFHRYPLVSTISCSISLI